MVINGCSNTYTFWLADDGFRLAEELLAKVRQLDNGGIVGNITHITHISITLANVTARLQDMRRYLSQVEDRVHMANSMNTANRRLITIIEVLYYVLLYEV